MNATILAARTATAIAEIEDQTRRLGGELSIKPARGDAAHRHLQMLEAVAAALAGIAGVPPEAVEESTAAVKATKEKARR